MSTTTTTNKLDSALLAAQADAPVLPQDARNSHANYSYCSAKKIIAIGGALLRRHGLVLIPLVSEPTECGSLHTGYLLRHAASGQSQHYTRTVAIHAHRGKEIDKATAAADTSAFAYMIRRILCLPDVECELNDPAPCAVEAEATPAPPPVRPKTPPVPVRVAPRPPMAAPRMSPAGAAMAKQFAEQTVERTATDKPAHKEATAHAGTNALLHERLRELSIAFRDHGERRGLKSRARAALLEEWAGCNLTGPHRSDPTSKMLLPDLVTGAVLEKIERGFSSWKQETAAAGAGATA